jgi:shikimate kinase
MAPVAVLVGAPGAGKSTIGPALAERLGLPFADSDDLIEAQAGKTVPEIFIDDGEPAFRALEKAAIADALGSFDGVLALGGGSILDPDTRAALAGHAVVLLSVSFPAAIKRVGLGLGRPLLSVNPRATLRYLMDQRLPLYREVAAYTVETDDREPDDIVTEVADLLKTGSRS